MPRRRVASGATAAAVAVVLGGCGVPGAAEGGPLRVVTSTAILADLARQVTGERAEVTSLVPPDGDPHSYEPTLRDIRDIVYADVAFTNYVLLEQHAIVKAIDANLPDGAASVALAEAAVKYAAEIIPLVENVNLDTIWLGLRVAGLGEQFGATRASEVELSMVSLDGPGRVTGYLTEAFGNPRIYFDSGDGLDPAGRGGRDTVVLPTDAHTHMSWTFDVPGTYRVGFAARLVVTDGAEVIDLGRGEVAFAAGVDPHSVPGMAGAEVLDGGHADITIDLDGGGLALVADSHHAGHAHQHVHRLGETVVAVPNKALAPVPAGADFRFLGRPGEMIFQLPQAVLGKHVHGEIDPHLWHDVRNAKAYVQIIRDTLVDADPDGAAGYRRNADRYLSELDAADAYVAERIAAIPPSRRHLVTTHDAFAYLAKAYGLEVAGFVTPNPSTEPSLHERQRLTETIRNLRVPAVFLEPNLAQRSSVLRQVARENGVAVCPLYADTFGEDVSSYTELVRFNADSLHACLS